MFIPYQHISNKLALLNTYFDSIQSEYMENFDNLEFRDFTEEQTNFIKDHGRGYPIGYDSYFSGKHRVEGKSGWHIAPLFAEDNLYYLNTQCLPILTDTLLQIGMTTVCAINVLDPLQCLEWHIDKDYVPGVKLHRIMWGLDCDDQESIIQLKDNDGNITTRQFKNKEFYIFHPETPHRVESKMGRPRSVVCIDYIGDTKYSGTSIL